jgi:hypothetical protein
MKTVTFELDLLEDKELVLRVKRRLPPTEWSTAAFVLSALQNVLERAPLGSPDPLDPKELAKRAKKKRGR